MLLLLTAAPLYNEGKHVSTLWLDSGWRVGVVVYETMIFAGYEYVGVLIPFSACLWPTATSVDQYERPVKLIGPY